MKVNKLNPSFMQRCRKYNVKHIDRSLTLFQIYIKYKGICQECKSKTVFGQHPQTSNSATMEHIIPLAKGGNHVATNVTLLCHSCNSSKNHQSRDEDKKIIGAINEYKKLFTIFGYEIYYKKGIK